MEVHVSGKYTEKDFPKFGSSYLMNCLSYIHIPKSKMFLCLQIFREIYAENHSSFPCVRSNFVLFQVASFFLLICNPFYTTQWKPIVCSE